MPVQYKDYYATLSVPKNASKDEIRKAFRRLARQYHPDVAKDKKTAESKFKEINEAYEVLGDPEKRQRYDQLGANWNQPQQTAPGWARGGGRPGSPGGAGFGGAGGSGGSFAGTGFSDFFEQFFSGNGGQGRAGFGFDHAESSRGNDIEADLLVTIEEALHGAKKKISFRRDERSSIETYELRVPRGVHEGQKIRLVGQGEAAGRRGAAGDLYLNVRFERHPDYRVEGSDLYYEMELPIFLAVLGGEISVSTPDGAVLLKIPAGTQPGRKFRLKGRGLPTGQETRGDFYVQIEIKVPMGLKTEQRELWEKLAALERAAD